MKTRKLVKHICTINKRRYTFTIEHNFILNFELSDNISFLSIVNIDR